MIKKLRTITLQTLSVAALLALPAVSGAQRMTGIFNSVAICGDSTVKSWGDNTDGQLGDSTRTDRNSPVAVKGLTGVTAVAAGEYHSLALKSDSTVWAWGNNGYGQLGDSTIITPRTVPVQMYGPTTTTYMKNVVAIEAGLKHSLVLKDDGSVWSVGTNDYGQLGDSTHTQRLTPIRVHGPGNVGFLSGITAISARELHSLALKSDSTVWSWGWNYVGELGDSTIIDRPVPVQVHGAGTAPYLTEITAIATGDFHCLALKSDSTVWGWGDGAYGELGDNMAMQRHIPVQMHGPGNVGYMTGIVAIAAGYQFSVLLKSDGTVWTVGANSNGGLGDSTTIQKNTPVQVHGPGNVGFLTGIVAIAAGDFHCLALKNDGTLWTWGWNSDGQIGDGTFTDRLTPVQVTMPCNLGNATCVASVVISTPKDSICPGTNITFTATPVNGGTPSYQWFKNGGNTGSVSPVYTSKNFINGDVISCVMTSTLSCATPQTVVSNDITITVYNVPTTPLITRSADTLYCSFDPTYPTYQWYDSSTIIQGATESYYVFTKNGNYNVSVTNENGCSVGAGITVTITGGRQLIVSGSPFMLSPNPAHNDLIITCSSSLRFPTAVTIYNVMGQVCYRAEIVKPKQEVDLSGLFPGIYFVEILPGIPGENTKWINKFIKE